MAEGKFISVVSPVYYGELTIDILVERLIHSLEIITNKYEIILVNDHSPDDSWKKIVALAANNKNIKGIALENNYGQHAAIKSGISKCKGDWVVIMDCDLQDTPEEIINLYNGIKRNTDAVFALRLKRHDKFLKRLYSSLFYFVLRLFTGIKFTGNAANFGIYSKEVIIRVVGSAPYYFCFPLEARRAVKHPEYLHVEHSQRIFGKTSYSFIKALRLAFAILAGNSFLWFLLRKNKEVVIKETINL